MVLAMDTHATSKSTDGGWLSQVVAWSKSVVGGTAARERRTTADTLYAAAVAQARSPAFYTELGVPDTRDARLELIQLHVILLLRRLQRDEAGGTALGQALFDAFFRDLDQSLREAGVGDLSVGKWIKKLAQQFYARVTAVEAALAQADGAGLEQVLRTTLAGGAAEAQVAALARYLLEADAELAARVARGTPLAALRFDGIDPIQASLVPSG